MTSKWNASKNAYAENQAYAVQKLLDDYGLSDMTDTVSNWYNTYNPISKYYFRSDDKNQEYSNLSSYLLNQMNNRIDKYLEDNYGTGWENNYWNDDSANELANNFVNSKYDSTLEQLERAYKRGTLNEAGYNSALNNLNSQKGTALSQVKSIGQGITDNYIEDLSSTLSNYMQDYDSTDLRDYNFDMSGADTAIQNKYNSQLDNFATDFDAQTSTLNPFDFSSILGTARADMGDYATNTTQQQTVQGEEAEKKNKKVGLGNTGLF